MICDQKKEKPGNRVRCSLVVVVAVVALVAVVAVVVLDDTFASTVVGEGSEIAVVVVVVDSTFVATAVEVEVAF